jgi:hypothetical protein
MKSIGIARVDCRLRRAENHCGNRPRKPLTVDWRMNRIVGEPRHSGHRDGLVRFIDGGCRWMAANLDELLKLCNSGEERSPKNNASVRQSQTKGLRWGSEI